MGFFDWVRGVKPAPVDTTPTTPQTRGGWWDADTEKLWSGVTVQDVLKRLPAGPRPASRVGDSAESVQPNRGSSISDALSMWYVNQGFIGHQLAALVAQNWLVFKACDMPSRDALRNGWRITGTLSDAEKEELERSDIRMGIKRTMRDFLTMGRVFGVRIAIPQINYEDPDAAYKLPFNPDGVRAGTFQGWVTVDPYWTAPGVTSTRPDQMHFYDPEYWTIGGRQYHRSHLIIYRHGLLADILKPAYYYGGIPLPQLIMERVYGAERTANEAPLLALTKRTVVYKTDLERALANYGQLQEKIKQQAELWNNFGVRIIDKEADEHQQFDTALADLDALIMTQYQLVAAASEVPATKLLGTSAKGFNATGENDEKNYHECLESIQGNDLQPLLDRHYLLLAASKSIKASVIAEWNPLAVPTASERATTAAAEATAAGTYIDKGVLGPDEVRRRLDEQEGGEYAGQLEPMQEEATPSENESLDQWRATQNAANMIRAGVITAEEERARIAAAKTDYVGIVSP